MSDRVRDALRGNTCFCSSIAVFVVHGAIALFPALAPLLAGGSATEVGYDRSQASSFHCSCRKARSLYAAEEIYGEGLGELTKITLIAESNLS